MPIYKTGDKKDGLTKYKVRVNYTDDSGKAHSCCLWLRCRQDT